MSLTNSHMESKHNAIIEDNINKVGDQRYRDGSTTKTIKAGAKISALNFKNAYKVVYALT